MIGNDIIDVSYTRRNSDWERKGFLDKVFTLTEQNDIAGSIDPFTTVWRLWSMKESVYKLQLRSKSKRSFCPSIISCKLLDDTKGIVSYDRVEYGTTTKLYNDYIFSFATHNDYAGVNHGIIKYDTKLPEDYYTFIKSELALNLDCKRNEIIIIKNEMGIPEIYRGNIKQDASLSITHHGRFLAWSLAK